MNSSQFKTKSKELSLVKRKSSFNVVSSCYTKEEAILEANRCLSCLKPLCVEGCPIHNNIPEILKAVREEKFEQAYLLLKQHTCFPDICGSICPHEKQCEGHCLRSKVKDGVNIGGVERFVAEYVSEHKLDEVNVKYNDKKVAVIGSGPASLAFALTMIDRGYQVTIFEKENHLGGLLYYGIPSFRLDQKYLKNYINKIEKSNAEIRLNIEVGKDVLLKDIISKFDCVFIGVGATKQNSMQIMDKNEKYVVFAGDFLKMINEAPIDTNGKKIVPNCGENVVVVGGGNAAMDAARNAIRLPQVKSVKITYRRSEKEMPAYLSELNDAKIEGVEFLTLLNPVKTIYKNDKLESVECVVMELGQPDSSGRRKPIESNKPHVVLKANTIVLALGSTTSKEFTNGTDIKVDDWGAIIVDENNKTSVKNVYAGGDAVTGSLTVVNAMKSGINAAKHFDNNFGK